MKKNAFKAIACVLSLSLFMAACGKKGGEEQPKQPEPQQDQAGEENKGAELGKPGEYPIAKEPIKMTMFRLSMPNVVDFATNDFTKFMEEKTNIIWDFQTANQDTSDEQVNLTMTKQPLPDVFLFATPSPSKYGVAEGLLMPIEDLIEENMPNFMKYVNEHPGFLDRLRQSDGHIYGLPAINDCYHCKYRNKMWVNTAHLKELGMEMPTTTEELTAVLKAYKEKFPNGVGISGSIDGWGQQFFNWISNAFIFSPDDSTQANVGKVVLSKDKKVESVATKDEYREALKYMNGLFNEGYIYDGTFTQKADQFRSLMNQEGDPVLFAPYGTISDAYDVKSRPESYANYRVIAPVAGPQGVRYAPYFKYDGMAENKFVVTKDCKNPAAALRWIDYFYTMEGYLNMQFGADAGKDWAPSPDGEKGLDGKPALYKILNDYSSEAQNHDWQDVGLNFATEEIRFGQATAQDVDIKSAEGLEKLLFVETKEKMEPYGQKEDGPYDLVPRLKLTAEEITETQQLTVDVDKYLNENRTAFIRGTMDPNDDAAWKQYLDGFKQVGLDRLVEIYQTAFDRQYK